VFGSDGVVLLLRFFGGKRHVPLGVGCSDVLSWPACAAW